jgi:hypothetical protein
MFDHDINKDSTRFIFRFLDGSQCPCLISSRSIDSEKNSSNILCSSCTVDSIQDLFDDKKEMDRRKNFFMRKRRL